MPAVDSYCFSLNPSSSAHSKRAHGDSAVGEEEMRMDSCRHKPWQLYEAVPFAHMNHSPKTERRPLNICDCRIEV